MIFVKIIIPCLFFKDDVVDHIGTKTGKGVFHPASTSMQMYNTQGLKLRKLGGRTSATRRKILVAKWKKSVTSATVQAATFSPACAVLLELSFVVVCYVVQKETLHYN